MTYTDALLCFVLTYGALWLLWQRFFAGRDSSMGDPRTWTDARQIRRRVEDMEPPLYTDDSVRG